MSTRENNYAQLHRFHDSVAVHFSGNETVYLSPAMAQRLSVELAQYAADCVAVKFTEANIGTTYIDGEGNDV